MKKELEQNSQQSSYGRLAFDMAQDIKSQLKNQQQKEVYKLKELYFKSDFNNGSWQTTFKGQEDSFIQVAFKTNIENQSVLFNLNGVNVYKSDNNHSSIYFNLPIVSVNTLTITCSNQSNSPFTLCVLGNVIDDKVNYPLYLIENENDIDAFYYDNGYKHSVITSPQQLLEKPPSTPLFNEVLNIGHILRGTGVVNIDDIGVLSLEDNYLTLRRKNTNFQTKRNIGVANIAEKAALIPIIHTRYSYHVAYYKNKALTSLYLDSNYNIMRTLEHNVDINYSITSMGGFTYKAGSTYLINGFWFIDSNNDAYLVVARNYARSSTVFYYHDITFPLGKADQIKLYINGDIVTCYKKYKHKLMVLTFHATLSNAINLLQLVKKESYSCCDYGCYLRDAHLLKYRDMFTVVTPNS